jgi:alpha-aminoadipic semialdehyde synthase
LLNIFYQGLKYILFLIKNHIHVASDIEEQAQKLAEKLGINRCSYSKVDVTNPNSLGPLVDNAEIVVSYVPAFLHMHVAKVCLEKSKHMITASYVTP